MSERSQGDLLKQMSMGAAVLRPIGGNIIYVDSVSGNDGNNGEYPHRAVKTLTRALALATAGDCIILDPGGSETVTSTLSVTVSDLKIICPVKNPASGFQIIGAGSLDLMTVSGADVHIEGLVFKRTAAAGAATAGILTTEAADRLTVVGCEFDYTDLTGTFSNFGIELTDALEDVRIEECRFRDCHRGIVTPIATGKTAIGLEILRCTFWVGQATAWGIYSDPTSTGTLSGLVIRECVFIEADGDGTAATDAWDGTTGLDGASGPIYLGALLDRFLIADCRAYAVSEVVFGGLCNIIATSLGQLHGNLPDIGMMTGEADIDVSEDVYTGFVEILNVAPRAGAPLQDLVVDIDVNKATTGWDTVSTAADTLDLAAVGKTDGTNYRQLANSAQFTANGDGSLEDSESGARFQLGPVADGMDVSIRAKVSAERADAEFPYRLTFKGQFPPVVTAVAAA